MLYPNHALAIAWENTGRRYPQNHTTQAGPIGDSCENCGKSVEPGGKLVLRLQYKGDVPHTFCSKRCAAEG